MGSETHLFECQHVKNALENLVDRLPDLLLTVRL